MKLFSKSKSIVFILALGIFLSAGVTFAAWQTDRWHSVDSWIKDGEVISAKKIAENFNYLYNKSSFTFVPDVLTANAIGWRGGSTGLGELKGYNFTGPSTVSSSAGFSSCFLTKNITLMTADSKYNGGGGCDLSKSGDTWTLKAVADKRMATKCVASCIR